MIYCTAIECFYNRVKLLKDNGVQVKKTVCKRQRVYVKPLTMPSDIEGEPEIVLGYVCADGTEDYYNRMEKAKK